MRAIFSGRRFSLRKVLRWLVLACVLPATLVSVTLVVSVYRLELQNVQQSTRLTAQTVMTELEQELGGAGPGPQAAPTPPADDAVGAPKGLHRGLE
jgi:hypothetical protein